MSSHGGSHDGHMGFWVGFVAISLVILAAILVYNKGTWGESKDALSGNPAEYLPSMVKESTVKEYPAPPPQPEELQAVPPDFEWALPKGQVVIWTLEVTDIEWKTVEKKDRRNVEVWVNIDPDNPPETRPAKVYRYGDDLPKYATNAVFVSKLATPIKIEVKQVAKKD